MDNGRWSGLSSFVNCSQINPFDWDLVEMTCYKEEKCFIYDGKRIKWVDSFEILKIFIKCVICQSGKWLSSGGKFTSSNTDLILTWNSDLGMLSFKGKVEKTLENLLIKMSTAKESTPTDTSGCSTLEELQGFIDRSYQNAFPQNGKISCPQSIDSSTPFRLRTVDSVL